MDYGTTDRCTGGTCTVHQGPNPGNIVDNNNGTYWEGNAGASLPGFIKYDFGDGVSWKISKINYRRRSGVANGVHAYKIRGSNDNTNWNDLTASQNFASSDGDQTITFTNQTAYRYVEIYITSSYDASLVSCEEIQMYEGIYPSGFFAFF